MEENEIKFNAPLEILRVVIQCFITLFLPPIILIMWVVSFFRIATQYSDDTYGLKAANDYVQIIFRNDVLTNVYIFILGILFLLWLLFSLYACYIFIQDLKLRKTDFRVDLDFKSTAERILYNIFVRALTFISVFGISVWFTLNSGYGRGLSSRITIEYFGGVAKFNELKITLLTDFWYLLTIVLLGVYFGTIIPSFYSALKRISLA